MKMFPIILSAPSGGGKTTIAKRLLETRKDVGYSVSCTTRPPRDDEKEGQDYYFLSTSEFLARQQRGEFAGVRRCTAICTARCGPRSNVS
jgi:guanylate kinase